MTNEEAIKELKYFSDILVKTSKVINSPFDLNEVNFVFKSEFIEAIDESITALEKQIPKKKKCYEDKYLHCPVCDEPIDFIWAKYPDKKESF